MWRMKKNRLLWQVPVLVVILFLLSIPGINYWAKWRLQQAIAHLPEKTINGLYHIKVGNSYLNIWNGEWVITDVTVQTDTAAWLTLRTQWPDSFPPLLSMTLKGMKIGNFNWIEYFYGREVHVRSLEIESPVITAFTKQDTTQHDPSNLRSQLRALPELLAPFTALLHVRKTSINDASIHLRTIQAPGDTSFQEIQHADLYIKDMHIKRHPEEITYCKELELKAAHVKTVFRRNTQMIEWEDFKFSKKGRLFSMQHFAFTPLRSEQAFFEDIGVRKAYFKFNCAEIVGRGFDLDRFIRYNYLYMDSLRVQEPVMHFTINKSLPLPYRKLLPHEMVARIENTFHIGTVVVKDGDILLTNRVPGRDFLISFNHSYITATNFSNDPLMMDARNPLDIRAESRLMNQSPIQLIMHIPLRSEQFDADYTASIDALPLDALNPVLDHKRLSIKSGYLQSAEIKSVIRNGAATGTVQMQYQGLQVAIMKKDTGKTRKVVSKIANILLNEDNEKDDPANFVIGNINLTRTRQEEYFAFLWHSIQTSMLPTVMPALKKVRSPES